MEPWWQGLPEEVARALRTGFYGSQMCRCRGKESLKVRQAKSWGKDSVNEKQKPAPSHLCALTECGRT